MAGIDTTSPHYKGKYASIYEVNKAYPSGGATGDYVDIQGFAHYWNADRNNWLVNQERDEYWDELLLAASAAVERIDKKLTDEITNRENSDEELWGAINNLPSYEDLLEADKQLSQRITAVENVVEEWPTDKDLSDYVTFTALQEALADYDLKVDSQIKGALQIYDTTIEEKINTKVEEAVSNLDIPKADIVLEDEVTSDSENAVKSKGIFNAITNMVNAKFVVLSEEEYKAMESHDETTFYFIKQ